MITRFQGLDILSLTFEDARGYRSKVNPDAPLVSCLYPPSDVTSVVACRYRVEEVLTERGVIHPELTYLTRWLCDLLRQGRPYAWAFLPEASIHTSVLPARWRLARLTNVEVELTEDIVASPVTLAVDDYRVSDRLTRLLRDTEDLLSEQLRREESDKSCPHCARSESGACPP